MHGVYASKYVCMTVCMNECITLSSDVVASSI